MGKRLDEAKAISGVLSAAARHTIMRLDPAKKQVYFEITSEVIKEHLQSDLNNRTVRYLLHLMEQAGCEIVVHAGLNHRTYMLAKLLKNHPNLKLMWSDPTKQKPRIVVTEQHNAPFGGEEKRILLHYDYRPHLSVDPPHTIAPYFMHPSIYELYKTHERLAEYRHTPRKIRMLFAGHYHIPPYDKTRFKRQFGILTRRQIIDHLFAKGLARLVSSQRELDEILTDGYEGMVIINSETLKIDPRRWLEVLSHADFFLCAPGMEMPMCHNAVEALAVGTIPLTNYPEWFLPSLADGENCFAFTTLEELEAQYAEILALGDGQISAMRRRAIDYYDRHLATDGLFQRLLDDPARVVHLHLLNETKAALAITAERI